MNNTIPNVDEVVSELVDIINQYCEDPKASINIINNIITSIKDNPDLFIEELEGNSYFFADENDRCPYCNIKLKNKMSNKEFATLCSEDSLPWKQIRICPRCKEEF